MQFGEDVKRAPPRLRTPEPLRDVADLDVLAYAQTAEQAHGLKSPHHAGVWKAVAGQPGAVALADDDRAGERPLKAGQDIDQCGLAGAVRADQAEDLAAFEPDTDFVDRDQTAEPDGHTLRQKGHG